MVNRTNYHLVKEYLNYLDTVAQLDVLSIGRYWFYLKHLLIWADETSFNDVAHRKPTFATFLATARLDASDKPLAPTTHKKIIQTTKRFFVWLQMAHPRAYRGIPASWVDALRPPRSVQATLEHNFITLEEVRKIAGLKIAEDDLALRRDQAAAVMLFLSGMRAGAFGTLPIGAVDLTTRTIKQWTSLGVETKNDKSATTYLLDIPDLIAIVERWDIFVRSQLPTTAMWYTPIISQWGEQTLVADRPGKNRNLALSKRIRQLFKLAGLPHKSPHKFRHGHAVYSLQHAKTMADYKAVSMNLMHDDIRVTDGIYAPLARNEVQQRIAGLTGKSCAEPSAPTDLETWLGTLSKEQLSQAVIAIVQRMAD